MSTQQSDLSSIESYLLAPASLTSIISLDEFRQFFPASLRSSPQVDALYAAACAQRDKDIAHVAANIAAEEQRRNDLLEHQPIPAPSTNDLDTRAQQEMTIDRMLANDTKGGVRSKASNQAAALPDLKKVLPALVNACETLQAEDEALVQREKELMEKLRTTIGDLSDLRYGKLPQEASGRNVADGAADALKKYRDEIGH